MTENIELPVFSEAKLSLIYDFWYFIRSNAPRILSEIFHSYFVSYLEHRNDPEKITMSL